MTRIREETAQCVRRPAKPTVTLVGEDGNVFHIIGKTTKALRAAGLAEEATAFQLAAFACHSYDEVLRLVMTVVEV